MNFLGTKDFYEYLNKYEIKLEPEIYVLFKRSQRVKFESLVSPSNQHLLTPQAIDCLQKMLLYDHEDRITAEEALRHPFFTPVKSFFENS